LIILPIVAFRNSLSFHLTIISQACTLLQAFTAALLRVIITFM